MPSSRGQIIREHALYKLYDTFISMKVDDIEQIEYERMDENYQDHQKAYIKYQEYIGSKMEIIEEFIKVKLKNYILGKDLVTCYS
jgi:hypothetical protein